jgi:hypothetical protein
MKEGKAVRLEVVLNRSKFCEFSFVPYFRIRIRTIKRVASDGFDDWSRRARSADLLKSDSTRFDMTRAVREDERNFGGMILAFDA